MSYLEQLFSNTGVGKDWWGKNRKVQFGKRPPEKTFNQDLRDENSPTTSGKEHLRQEECANNVSPEQMEINSTCRNHTENRQQLDYKDTDGNLWDEGTWWLQTSRSFVISSGFILNLKLPYVFLLTYQYLLLDCKHHKNRPYFVSFHILSIRI